MSEYPYIPPPPNPISHRGPSQTSPDIFATDISHAFGHASGGRHYQWSINLTLTGSCSWKSPYEEFMVQPGDLLITKPQLPSAWYVTDGVSEARPKRSGLRPRWHVMYAVFNPRPHWLPWIESLDFAYGKALTHFEGSRLAELSDAFNRLIEIYNAARVGRDDRAMNALELVLIAVKDLCTVRATALDPRVSAAIEFINAQFGRPLALRDIADCASLGPSRVTQLFTESMGISPLAFVEQVRLTHAAELLRFSRLSVGEISNRVGYADASYFCRRFHLRYNCSPKVFRCIKITTSPLE